MVQFHTQCWTVLVLFNLCDGAPAAQDDQPAPLSGLLDLAQVPLQVGDSLLKATNATAPLIFRGLKEFSDTVPLLLGFARSYAEVQQENNQKVFGIFISTFLCDLTCKNEKDEIKKQVCEEQFCKSEKEDTETEEDVVNESSEV